MAKKKTEKKTSSRTTTGITFIRHRVVCSGTVVTNDKTVVPGANVEILDSDGSLTDRTTTATDGSFFFMDLPTGEFRVTASSPLAGSRLGDAGPTDITISDGVANPITLTVPVTSVAGQVVHGVSTAVPFATVRLSSGEATLSDSDGKFELKQVEAGKQKLTVDAAGFQTAVVSLELAQGSATTVPASRTTLQAAST